MIASQCKTTCFECCSPTAARHTCKVCTPSPAKCSSPGSVRIGMAEDKYAVMMDMRPRSSRLPRYSSNDQRRRKPGESSSSKRLTFFIAYVRGSTHVKEPVFAPLTMIREVLTRTTRLSTPLGILKTPSYPVLQPVRFPRKET
jgi:hypothetical protein